VAAPEWAGSGEPGGGGGGGGGREFGGDNGGDGGGVYEVPVPTFDQSFDCNEFLAEETPPDAEPLLVHVTRQAQLFKMFVQKREMASDIDLFDRLCFKRMFLRAWRHNFLSARPLTGMLYKAMRGTLCKAWERRLFELRGNVLAYYRNGDRLLKLMQEVAKLRSRLLAARRDGSARPLTDAGHAGTAATARSLRAMLPGRAAAAAGAAGPGAAGPCPGDEGGGAGGVREGVGKGALPLIPPFVPHHPRPHRGGDPLHRRRHVSHAVRAAAGEPGGGGPASAVVVALARLRRRPWRPWRRHGGARRHRRSHCDGVCCHGSHGAHHWRRGARRADAVR